MRGITRLDEYASPLEPQICHLLSILWIRIFTGEENSQIRIHETHESIEHIELSEPVHDVFSMYSTHCIKL